LPAFFFPFYFFFPFIIPAGILEHSDVFPLGTRHWKAEARRTGQLLSVLPPDLFLIIALNQARVLGLGGFWHSAITGVC
jgi:hypothetical protein